MQIRLRPEVIFVEQDDNLTVISATKHKNLKASWIRPLHQKLFPVLSKGCSEKLLLGSVDASRKVIVRTYINALKQCEALTFDGNHIKENGDSLPDDFHNEYAFFSLSSIKKQSFSDVLSRNKKLFIESDDRNTIICLTDHDSFLPPIDYLLKRKQYKRVIFFLIDISQDLQNLLPEIFDWASSLLVLPFTGNERLLIYSINENDGLNCKLKFKKSLNSSSDLQELFWKTGTIGQQSDISQIPLVFVRTGNESSVREITIGLNYHSIAADSAVRENVRQMLFSEWKEKSDEQTGEEKLSNRFKNVLTSASKTELCGKILDFAGKRIFDEPQFAKREIDGLTAFEKIAEIKYLQNILRVRFDSLLISESESRGFFRYEGNGFSAVSICREKALFDLLLRIAAAEFYSAFAKDSDYSFYSGFAPFADRRELKKLIKKSGRFSRFDEKTDLPPIKKIETFWGEFFWTEIYDEGKMI